MNEQNILYSAILCVVALISIVVGAIVWGRRFAPGGLALVFYMLAMAWWSGTYALYWANVYPHGHFWLDATYVGVVGLTPPFFVFVLQFTHRQHWLNRPLLALLISQPVLTVVLLWTDPWHGLFFGGQRSATDSTIFAGGPWFWANLVYIYSLYLFMILLLIKSFFTVHVLYRRQIGLVLLATLIPWAANIITLMGLNPLPKLDLTPIAFMLTGIIMAFSLFRYRFLEVVPVARDRLIENMNDGIVVVDTQNRVVDVNPAAAALLGLESSTLIGQDVAQLIPDWSQLQVACAENDPTGAEIVIQREPLLHLNVRLIRLNDRQQREQGKLIILRNITTRKLLEAEREQLISTLQTTLGQVKTLSGLLPICSNCKKIRDDDGYWQDVAVYVRDHSEADFTHGICPDCAKELYPEFYNRGGK